MLPTHRVTTHPGEILVREFLVPLQLNQAELAKKLGISQNRVNELVRGKRGITAETALLLSDYFQNSAEFWMNLQSAYNLSRAIMKVRHKPVPARGNRVRNHRHALSTAS